MNQMRFRPQKLKQGDTVGIIAPSSPPDQKSLEKSLEFLRGLGLKWKFGDHVKDVYGYLAGTDESRLDDIHKMFKDPEVKAIICAGGGFGSARYTDQLDFELIRQNPKIFWGFSDVTFLHTAIGLYSNLVTFHGPMLASCVGRESFHDLSAKMFNQLFEPKELRYEQSITPLETIHDGVVTGEIVGGNLSLLAHSLGTPYEVNTKGKILFLEDIGEEPYRVDGLLNQLRLAGKLEDAAGIVIGDFADAEPQKRKISLTLTELFDHYTKNLKIPVVKGFNIGHCEPHFSIPLGVEATLDANELTLTIKPGVE